MTAVEDQLRPELERWMMAYHDIETRLWAQLQKSSI
jgi:hypothetical protein